MWPGQSSSWTGSAGGREGSLIDTLTESSIWIRLIRVVLGESHDGVGAFVEPGVWSAYVVSAGALAVVVVAVVRARDLQLSDRPDRLCSGWILLVAASVASVVMAAQHISGGGNPFRRYLLLAAPLWSCTVATALVTNCLNRWLVGLLATAVLTALFVRQFAMRYASYTFAREFAPESATGIGWAATSTGLFLAAAMSIGGILCAARLAYVSAVAGRAGTAQLPEVPGAPSTTSPDHKDPLRGHAPTPRR